MTGPQDFAGKNDQGDELDDGGREDSICVSESPERSPDTSKACHGTGQYHPDTHTAQVRGPARSVTPVTLPEASGLPGSPYTLLA
jgi:hypothetical protein